jgi:Tfp pilus assembly protein PilV
MGKQMMKKNTPHSPGKSGKARAVRGFSLVELMVAIFVFMVVGGAAVSLVRSHMPLFTQQQNQAALNVSLRNAIAQMQIDVVNAGTGYYPADDIPAWPIGVTIRNRNGGGCFDPAAQTYTANCFDTLNVIAFDLNTPAAHPIVGCVNSNDPSARIWLLPADAGIPNSTLANSLKQGDELLLVKNDGSQLTTVSLSGDADVNNGFVRVPIVPTQNNGVHDNDPLAIADATVAGNGVLGTQFCAGDWALKLAPITYGVDATDPTNPKLVRQVNGGAADVVAEQVLGFKVGAWLRSGAGSEINGYNYDSGDPAVTGNVHAYNGNWSAITSIRVSLIGRASANGDVTNNFRNSFDQGRYKVEGVSVVINPRNLTMNN